MNYVFICKLGNFWVVFQFDGSEVEALKLHPSTEVDEEFSHHSFGFRIFIDKCARARIFNEKFNSNLLLTGI
jgi:hypothetical protein